MKRSSSQLKIMKTLQVCCFMHCVTQRRVCGIEVHLPCIRDNDKIDQFWSRLVTSWFMLGYVDIVVSDTAVDVKKCPEDSIKEWLDAVGQCLTLSRLNVLIGILESCIKWEKSAENAVCTV